MSARERRAKARKRDHAHGHRLTGPAAFAATVAIGLAGPGLGAADASGVSTSQLDNINTVALGSNPKNLTDVSGTLYFSAHSATYGTELWSTTGSRVHLVDDIDPGVDGSYPTDLYNAGGHLFFSTSTDPGETLWTTNGSPSRTTPLTNLSSSIYESADSEANVGHTFYELGQQYTANGQSGLLTASNGTPAGTTQTNLPGVSDGDDLVEAGSTAAAVKLYFVAEGDTSATQDDEELWRTNGAAAGTVQLTSFIGANSVSEEQVSSLVNVNGTLFFSADGGDGSQVFRLNGAKATAVTKLGPDTSVNDLVSNGTALFFTTSNETNGSEVWTATKKTASELTQTGDEGQDENAELTDVSGRMYFISDAGGDSDALWETNGSVASTTAVSNVSDAMDLTNDDGTLAFTTPDALWTSNGTSAGTVEVNSSLYSPAELTNSGAELYFSASNATTGDHLWGLTHGTVTEVDAKVTAGETQGSYPADFTADGSGAFFTATSGGVGPGGGNFWFSNGTPAGTHSIQASNGEALFPEDLTNVDGTVYFGQYNRGSQQLWASNGSPAGATLVGGSTGQYLSELTNGDGELYYLADGATAATDDYPELWKTNGTGGNATQLTSFSNFDAHIGDAFYADDLVANAGSQVYFDVSTPNGENLWTSNGTVAGTVPVTDSASSNFPDVSYLSEFTAVGNDLYFVATNQSPTQLSELWVTNGTAAGTVELASLPNDSYEAVNVNGILMFTENGDLWRSNGTVAGTTEIEPGVDAGDLTDVGNELYFLSGANQPSSIWKSNGTTAGTSAVDSVADAENLTNANGLLAFTANDGTHGIELWTSNGTAAGTGMVSDIWPGAGSGLARSSNGGEFTPDLTSAGSNLFFAADNGTDGVEPWVATGFTGPGAGSGSASIVAPSGSPNSSSGASSCTLSCARRVVTSRSGTTAMTVTARMGGGGRMNKSTVTRAGT